MTAIRERIPIRSAHVGDYALFRSGLRKITGRWRNGLQFLLSRPSTIGGAGWRVGRLPDGARRTTYTWTDLDRLGVSVAVRRGDPGP